MTDLQTDMKDTKSIVTDDEWLKAMNLALTIQLMDSMKVLQSVTTSLSAHLTDVVLSKTKMEKDINEMLIETLRMTNSMHYTGDRR
jgi:hypothetical protein